MTKLGRSLAIAAIFAIVAVALASRTGSTTLSVTDFGAKPDSREDATVPFQKAIAAAKKLNRPVTLIVPKGRYDFFPDNAARRACYYSNATEDGADAIRTIAIDLSDLNDFTIQGNGASLVMRGKMTMIVAERSQNISLADLTFDFARPTVSEIVATEKGSNYWIGRVHRDSTYRLVGNRIEWYGENWHAFHNLTQHFDPATKTTWRGDDPTENATSIRQVGKDLLRFEVPSDSLKAVAVGRIYQFRDVTRDEAGMWFSRCKNVSLDHVKVRFMAGFGALFQYSDGATLEKVEVAPDPSSGRTCASAADILHFSGCKGKIVVADSVLSAAHDDAINVHGTHLQVVKVEDPQTLRVRFMHPQTWGFVAFSPGDEIELVHSDSLIPYAKTRIVGFKMANSKEQILTLDRPAPAALVSNSDIVENVSWTPSVEIRNCDISLVPTRGILVTTRRPVRIVGNRFVRIPMPSVEIADDGRSWYESGPVKDVFISGNRFFECSGPIVHVDPQNSAFGGPVHRNVRVVGNQFLGCSLPGISTKALDGLEVTGNAFTFAGPVFTSRKRAVETEQTGRIKVADNTFDRHR